MSTDRALSFVDAIREATDQEMDSSSATEPNASSARRFPRTR